MDVFPIDGAEFTYEVAVKQYNNWKTGTYWRISQDSLNLRVNTLKHQSLYMDLCRYL